MSSIFFQFYYDDGSMRPFDPDLSTEIDTSQYEVPEVHTDGMIDLFSWRKQELQELGLTDVALFPSFIANFVEDAEDKGLGVEENVWWENMTIPVEPSELKLWAKMWFTTLQEMTDDQRETVLPYNSNYLTNVAGLESKIHEREANFSAPVDADVVDGSRISE